MTRRYRKHNATYWKTGKKVVASRRQEKCKHGERSMCARSPICKYFYAWFPSMKG